MPDTIRHRVQQLMQQRISATGEVNYADLRDTVLRQYPVNYPPASEDDWDRWMRDAVMREVQSVLEDISG